MKKFNKYNGNKNYRGFRDSLNAEAMFINSES